MLYLVGAAISLALLTLYGWPPEGTIASTQRSLEHAGGRADFTVALGG